MRTLPLVIIAVGAIAATGSSVAQTLTDPNLSLSVVATGFAEATQMRFLGANDLLIAQKNGTVRRWNNGVVSTVLELSVEAHGERGLLGLTLHPDFNSNGAVYIYYSARDGANWAGNRLSRFTWDGSTLGGEVVVRTFGFPADGQPSLQLHHGGPIAFGPDGKLYGTVGDMQRNRAEQNNQSASDLSSGAGGVYRLNDDGTVPSDNPFVSHSNAQLHPWYAYGIRNTYGIAFDPVTGSLWDSENGPENYDEINLVERGFNSGWRPLMGPSQRNPQGLEQLVSLPGSDYSDPEFSFHGPVVATGLCFLSGSSWGESYANGLIIGGSGSLFLFRLGEGRDRFDFTEPGLLDLVADGNEVNLVRFGSGFSGIPVDIQIGPDGAVYVLSHSFSALSGHVYRIVPEPTYATWLIGFAGVMVSRRRWRCTAERASPSTDVT